jgi:hypothetical protein
MLLALNFALSAPVGVIVFALIAGMTARGYDGWML